MLLVHPNLIAVLAQEVSGVPARDLPKIGHEVSRAVGDGGNALGSREVEAQQHSVGVSVGLCGGRPFAKAWVAGQQHLMAGHVARNLVRASRR
jgi:hypothetical protein